MEKTLYELFMEAQNGDEKAKLELYEKFLLRIKKFGKKLFYEEAETDLTIFLLEFINKVDLEKFKIERMRKLIVMYIRFLRTNI